MQKISQEQIESAKNLASRILNTYAKQNAYLNFLGVGFFANYMLENGFIISTKRSLYKYSKLYSDFEITDIYCNSHKYYVLSSKESEFVKIPKKHKELNVLPEAYIAVKISQNDSEAEILGFFEPTDLNELDESDGYYLYKTSNLLNIEELKEKTKQKVEAKHSSGSHIDCLKHIKAYADGNLSEDETKTFILHIVSCESCKRKLFEALEKKEISSPSNWPDEIVIQDISKEKQNLEMQEVIDTIYQDKELGIKENSAFKYSFELPFKLKKPLILTGVVVLIILFLIIGAISLSGGKNKADKKDIQGVVLENEYNENYDNQTENYDLKLPPVRTNKGYATVSNVSWEVSSNLNKDEYKKFLQQAGKTIRLNLQNDLLLSNEAIVNSRVKFEMKFYRDGNLESLDIVRSSGSGAVDSVIKQSVSNTMQYMKPPRGAFVGSRNSIVLVIDF